MSKLDGELRTLAAEGGDEPVLVYILARPGADLKGVAEVTETRPFMDGELVVAKVKPAMLTKMASHPDVMAAQAFRAIEAPIPLTPRGEEAQRPTRPQIREMREKAAERKADGSEGFSPRAVPRGAASTASSGGVSPQDWHGVGVIGAEEAWAKGYTGEGVNIAILDSGVDFGHPDLEGKQATYSGGPYDGWPIALDPRSMRQYYYYGLTSWDNYDDETDYTWYAGVDDVIYCTTGITETFGFDGFTYAIAPDIVDMSKSGAIRWSVHPDVQFPDYVSAGEEWMPFILLDTTTAGVYDTVIADLDFDLWFDGNDDVANKADPVLSQDLGSYIYTDTVVMTGTQYIPDWWLGYPPTWYGSPDVATTAMTLTVGSWIMALDHNAAVGATDGADGIADVSGGMVYYVADGVNSIPGMDHLYPGIPPSADADAIPFNGQLVAFMLGSDYVAGYDHGTLCASASVAGGEIKGYFSSGMGDEWVQYDPEDWSSMLDADGVSEYMPWLKPADEGTVQGPAPGAKIIAIGACYDTVNSMQGFYDAYTFLAYGADGEPNSGDEFVDIVSMSYGAGTVHNDGWDWESRLLSYYNENYLNRTTFHASSGNGGHGFGTVNSPQGNTAVTVGASTMYGPSTSFGGALAADQFNDGDIVHFSGRGPDTMGRPDPDVVATGGWGAGDTPLNMAGIYNTFFNGWFPGDGHNAWYEWGGTSRSSPEAAGVTALVYEAYKDAHGTFPDFETARQILMSGADDLNHDVLMQGAGRVNADRATDVAGGLEGVYVSPSLLAAGEYDGTHYESFGNVLYPGDTWAQTFAVYNTGGSAASVTVGDEVLLQMDVLTYTVVVSPELSLEDDSYPDNYFFYADYFVVADPAQAVITNTNPLTPSLGFTYTLHGDSLVIPVPSGADFMQVQLVVPFEVFDFDYNDPDATSVSYVLDERWSLTVYDWQDRNGDAKLWADQSDDRVVNPQDTADELDISYLGVVTQTEINRFSYGYNYANEQEVTVGLGETRADANIVIGIVHRHPNDARPGWGPDEYQENPLQVKVIFYQKADWGLVTESPISLSVAAGGSATFDATFSIPAGQAPGLYEGAITVDDGSHTSIIPTTVNVAVPGDELLFTLGGTDPAGTPYDNGRMTGGWTWSGVYEEGDWRFYYYDADAGFEQQYLYVRNQWGDMCLNMPTANETVLWGPNPGDQFSMLEPGRFGPYGMQYAGGTWDAYGSQNGWGTPREGDWWLDGDGMPQPETRVWGTLWDGLNQVQFRNILLSGKQECGEGFEATAGVFGVDAPGSVQGGIQIDADAHSGSFTLDAVSPVNGLIAYASGFGQEQWFRHQDVPQGKHYESWPEDLMDGWVHTFEVTNTSAIKVDTFGPSSSDIDLYLMCDANGDGVFNPQDNREQLAYSFNLGSTEHILYQGSFSSGYRVQDGTYAVVMYGYGVRTGDQFDLRLRAFGGDDLSVAGAGPDNNYVLGVTPGVSQTLTVNWRVPGSGVWQGYLWFAMPWEEEPQYRHMGPSLYVPVVINAPGVDVSRSTKTVDKELVPVRSLGQDREILTHRITLVNDGSLDVQVTVKDLLPAGLSYRQAYTDTQTFQGTYVAHWWNDAGQHGFFDQDVNDYINWAGTVGPGTGKVYIEYRVVVDAGFVGRIVNEAEISAAVGGYQASLSRTAVTDVRHYIYLPAALKDYP